MSKTLMRLRASAPRLGLAAIVLSACQGMQTSPVGFDAPPLEDVELPRARVEKTVTLRILDPDQTLVTQLRKVAGCTDVDTCEEASTFLSSLRSPSGSDASRDDAERFARACASELGNESASVRLVAARCVAYRSHESRADPAVAEAIVGAYERERNAHVRLELGSSMARMRQLTEVHGRRIVAASIDVARRYGEPTAGPLLYGLRDPYRPPTDDLIELAILQLSQPADIDRRPAFTILGQAVTNDERICATLADHVAASPEDWPDVVGPLNRLGERCTQKEQARAVDAIVADIGAPPRFIHGHFFMELATLMKNAKMTSTRVAEVLAAIDAWKATLPKCHNRFGYGYVSGCLTPELASQLDQLKKTVGTS